MLDNAIREVTTSTGTGNLVLQATPGFVRFGQRFATNSRVAYAIRSGNDWEWGIGTYLGSDQLARTTVVATWVDATSTYNNTDPAPLNLPPGQKVVECVQFAGMTRAGTKLSPRFTGREKLLIETEGGLIRLTEAAWLRGHPIRVLLLAGQSNADGWAPNSSLPANLQDPIANALIYYKASADQVDNGEFQVIQAGINNKTSNVPANDAEHGCEIRLLSNLVALWADEVPVCLVKYALDSSALSPPAPTNNSLYWVPSNEQLYTRFVEYYVKRALRDLRTLGYDPYLQCFIWVHGGSDAENTTAAALYEQNLTALINSLRSDLRTPDLPAIIVRRQPGDPQVYPGIDTVRAAQAAVAANIGNGYLIDADGYSELGDDIHFDAAGYQAMAEDIQEVLEGIGHIGSYWPLAPIGPVEQQGGGGGPGGEFGFEDDFERADSADVGNSWVEASNVWGINSGQVVKTATGSSAPGNLCHRPFATESITNIEAAVQVRFQNASPNFPQIHVRANNINVGAGSINSYLMFVDGNLTSLIIGRRNSASGLTSLATFSAAMNTTDLFRLRLRVQNTGNPDPTSQVTVTGWVDRWTGSEWEVVGTNSANDVSASRHTGAGVCGFSAFTGATPGFVYEAFGYTDLDA